MDFVVPETENCFQWKKYFLKREIFSGFEIRASIYRQQIFAMNPIHGDSALRPDFYARADRHQLPDFFNLGVGHCNAPFGPVDLPVQRPEISKLFCQPMDHDVTAWVGAQFPRPLSVGRTGIRDM